MLRFFLDLLFPKTCIGCERSGTSLCAICERSIIVKPTVLGDGMAALFHYHNPLVKKAIWNLKFHHRREIGEYLGVALFREFFSDMLALPEHERKPMLIVPIPLSKKERRERGYNHAEEIAQALVEFAKASNLPLSLETNVLKKSRDTNRQVDVVGKHARQENLKNAYAVEHPARIQGKIIVLIDDVITTGSTMREARTTLKFAGAKKVLCIAAAH